MGLFIEMFPAPCTELGTLPFIEIFAVMAMPDAAPELTEPGQHGATVQSSSKIAVNRAETKGDNSERIALKSLRNLDGSFLGG